MVYVFPGPSYLEMAAKFLYSYHANPPGLDHSTIIVTQGEPASGEVQYLFGSLPNCSFLEHDNSGYDIGAFQHAARVTDCDVMVFLGASAYIRIAGWMIRVADSFTKYGDTLYGVMANRGVPHVGVQPHIRSTGFWLSPALLRQYPETVTRPEQRYPFEHGPNCLTTWITRQKKIPFVVSKLGEYTWANWDMVPGGFHQNNQENLLIGDRLSGPPYFFTD